MVRASFRNAPTGRPSHTLALIYLPMIGWLLDLYTHPDDGLVLWLLDEDGQRRRLHQSFPIAFYAAGPPSRLRQAWQFLQAQSAAVELSRLERRDIFAEQPQVVLSVKVANPAEQPGLFRQVSERFPELTYYDADLPISLRHAAVYGTFPLARCQVAAGEAGLVQELSVLSSPWEVDSEPVPLRVLSLEPDCDPAHAPPSCLTIRLAEGSSAVSRIEPPAAYRLPLAHERPLLVNLGAILRRHDPDLLLTAWGDTWLLAHLLALSRRWNIPLPLNRDRTRKPAARPERSYFSYGQVIHRGRQIHLFGRWHIDAQNAMLFHDYWLEGVLELSRVTALPVQTSARVSPGTGISAMQIVTALRQEVLVPWHKQQAERPKTALRLLRTDQGGLVFQPTLGLHRDVAEIDFISMYPSIMARFNVSPETVGIDRPGAQLIPQLGVPIVQEPRGLVPQTLAPLLDKRLALKAELARLPKWDPRRQAYKARSSAHKWLLVTCFGYLGYKNARFGRIEAHEAVTAYGREALLRAKEAAEDQGFRVLHLYVDGMWVQKPGLSQPADFQPLLAEIVRRTSLSISLDGVYRWVAFLPSRQDERVAVANRYFGVFQDGSLKTRGIDLRRRDTCPFVADTQAAILDLLASAASAGELPGILPKTISLLRSQLTKLRSGKVPLEYLLVRQKVSRSLSEYRAPSAAARATTQLQGVNKILRPGQIVSFIYTRGEPGVWAWNLPARPDAKSVDVKRYTRLLLRAASAVLQPLGLNEKDLTSLVLANAVPVCLPARAFLEKHLPG